MQAGENNDHTSTEGNEMQSFLHLHAWVHCSLDFWGVGGSYDLNPNSNNVLTFLFLDSSIQSSSYWLPTMIDEAASSPTSSGQFLLHFSYIYFLHDLK